MSKCKNCKNIKRLPLGNWCAKITDSPDIERDRECPYFQIVSNADRIRAMTDEELAEFFEGINKGWDVTYGDYISTKEGVFISDRKDLAKEILKWLQSEAE